MSVVPDLKETRAEDALVLLANDAMRARRRPSVVIGLWLWETALAMLLAYPATAMIKSAYGDHPRGDAPLWTPGGRELLDLFTSTQHAIPTILALGLVVLAAAAILGLLPHAGALVAIAYTTRDLRAPRLRDVAMRAVSAFFPLAIILAVTSILQLVVVFLGSALGTSTGAALTHSLGEARAEQVGWIVTIVFFAIAALLGVAQDLARAAVVRFRVRAVAAMRLGLNALRRAPFVTFWSWAWRSAAGLVPMAMGALVAERIGGRGGAVLFVLLVLHQLVIGVRVALHASWLAKALRAVDYAHRVVRAR